MFLIAENGLKCHDRPLGIITFFPNHYELHVHYHMVLDIKILIQLEMRNWSMYGEQRPTDKNSSKKRFSDILNIFLIFLKFSFSLIKVLSNFFQYSRCTKVQELSTKSRSLHLLNAFCLSHLKSIMNSNKNTYVCGYVEVCYSVITWQFINDFT